MPAPEMPADSDKLTGLVSGLAEPPDHVEQLALFHIFAMAS